MSFGITYSNMCEINKTEEQNVESVINIEDDNITKALEFLDKEVEFLAKVISDESRGLEDRRAFLKPMKLVLEVEKLLKER